MDSHLTGPLCEFCKFFSMSNSIFPNVYCMNVARNKIFTCLSVGFVWSLKEMDLKIKFFLKIGFKLAEVLRNPWKVTFHSHILEFERQLLKIKTPSLMLTCSFLKHLWNMGCALAKVWQSSRFWAKFPCNKYIQPLFFIRPQSVERMQVAWWEKKRSNCLCTKWNITTKARRQVLLIWWRVTCCCCPVWRGFQNVQVWLTCWVSPEDFVFLFVENRCILVSFVLQKAVFFFCVFLFLCCLGYFPSPIFLDKWVTVPDRADVKACSAPGVPWSCFRKRNLSPEIFGILNINYAHLANMKEPIARLSQITRKLFLKTDAHSWLNSSTDSSWHHRERSVGCVNSDVKMLLGLKLAVLLLVEGKFPSSWFCLFTSSWRMAVKKCSVLFTKTTTIVETNLNLKSAEKLGVLASWDHKSFNPQRKWKKCFS